MSFNSSFELENTTLVDFEPSEISQTSSKRCFQIEKKRFKIPFKKKKPSFTESETFNHQTRDLYQTKLNVSTNSCTNKNNTVEDRELREAFKILSSFDKELRTRKLIQKWRNITQGAMCYILNMTLCKIDRIGGYEELRKKELKTQKKRLEYMMDDSMQEEMYNILESDEFNQLPDDDQEEYKRMLEEKLKEFENHKQKELMKIDEEMNNTTNGEMNMIELSKRLKISYSLVYPAEET